MGGLGRTINGSYAEYTRVRASNVALIESDLSWARTGGAPGDLRHRLDLPVPQPRDLTAGPDPGDPGCDLIVRSGRGQDGCRLPGARVIATTRNRGRFAMLEQLGVSRVEVEAPDLSTRITEAKQIDAVLDLVGNSTILDSLDMLRRGGSACLAGWLGGLAPIADFNPLLQMASGVNLTFFGSFVFGTPGFPLSDVPLQAIARQVQAGRLEAKPSRVFSLRRDSRSAPRHGSRRGRRQDGGRPGLTREHQRALDLLDRLGHLDAARAGLGAVERGAAAPHAVDLVEDVQPFGGGLVAAVEDEPVGVDDRGRTEVAALATSTPGSSSCSRRTGCTWWCRRSGRGRSGSGSAPASAGCRW